MQKRLFSTLLFIALTIFSINSFALTPAAQLRHKLVSIKTIQANFSQKVYARGSLKRSFNGSMAIVKPGRFRWVVDSPRKLQIIADGRRIWIYEPGIKQATVKSMSKGLGNTPASILSGKLLALGRAFYITFQRGWYIMTPNFNSNFKQIQLRFSGNSNRLSNMRLLDKFGQTSTVNFSNVRVNGSVSSSLFRFSPPKGVDVVGSR